jgi:hypothetical protein
MNEVFTLGNHAIPEGRKVRRRPQNMAGRRAEPVAARCSSNIRIIPAMTLEFTRMAPGPIETWKAWKFKAKRAPLWKVIFAGITAWMTFRLQVTRDIPAHGM